MSAQPEALRIATRAERIFKVLEGNETVPTMRVMEFMQEAAAELRRLHAGIEAEREARQAAQIENEALKARIARADVELQRAVIAEREACAKVAKAISDKYAFGYYGNEVDTADEIEAAIRARGAA